MRPRDINCNVCVSNSEEERDLYFIDEFNTQNTIDSNQLNFLKNHHNITDNEISIKKIKTKTLDKILIENSFYDIDFFNIDIEGNELEVIEALNFDKFKIKYICIEMIEHNEISIKKSKMIKNILENNKFKIIKNFGFNHIYKNSLISE
jgi:FkbM family methyltransferase